MNDSRRSVYRSLVCLVVLLVGYGLLSFTTDNRYYMLILAVIPIWATLGISWNIFSGYSGLVSFGHAVFFGTGAYTVALLLVHFSISPWISIPLAAIAGAITAYIIGRITFRLRGVYFALAMLAYSLVLIYVFDWLGLHEMTLPMKRENPVMYMQFDDNQVYVLLSLILFAVAFLTSLLIEHSRFGVSLLAIKQNELAAEAAGVDSFGWKLRAIVVSGAIGSAAGGLFAVVQLVVTPNSVFGLVTSAQAMIFALFGGAGVAWGPVIGAFVLVPFAEFLHAELGHMVPGLQGMVYGVALVAVMVLAPEGVYWKIINAFRKATGRDQYDATSDRTASPAGTTTDSTVVPLSRAHAQPGEVLLSVRQLSKSYGGLHAVRDVSFDVRAREIVGLVGPNGAGKTSLFNLLSGLAYSDSGQIVFNGQDVTRLKPHRRCELGIGRTFQVVRPFPYMSLEENALVGAYVHAANEDDARARARKALDRVGLTSRASVPAGAVPTIELRLMELARALAADPTILLLDEPLAGLGAQEVERFMQVVKQLAAEGITIVLIEHTMHAVVGLVDRLIVLDHGSLLMDGEPAEVTRDSRVVEAYLGKKWATNHA